LARLQVEEYDEIICLDKEPFSTAAAVLTGTMIEIDREEKGIKQKRRTIRKGFLMQEQGNICPANKEAEYTFSLGLSDELKFKKNKKTYQQLIYEVCGLKYEKDEYVFKLTDEEIDFARNKFGSRLKPNKPVIGLNIGSDKMFTGKAWRVQGFIELAQKIYNDTGANILILGGAEERRKNKILLDKIKAPIIDTGCDNDLRQFAGIINLCDIIVTGDTLCLHIGIALKKKIAALFASTCAQEIDLYNRGEFIISPAECAPCYRKDCPYDLKCMDLISVDSVYTAVKGLLK
ncbi:MAG: glycosyltransferase family 9 protein, partial [Candidatus Omnitrophica bacterium]|nr:glycosyltransferase family 9 protein [Candidatus Omnitrophota bacterium]